jgi:ABC-type multidrug transport system fused ATPase/permease subunit
MFLSKKSFAQTIKILSVDFKKPWWRLIVDQRWLFTVIMSAIVLVYGFWTLTPFFIENLFGDPTVAMAAFLFTSWVAVDYIHAYARQLNARFQLQCIHSIYHSAHRYLLTIDPRYHVHRSSGTVLGKIERGARGYEELLDQITFEFVPLLVGLVLMTGALWRYSVLLAGVTAVLFVAMLLFGYYFARYTCRKWEQDFIETDDAFKGAAVENLAQVHMVRASFASDYMNEKLRERIETNIRSEGNLWLSYTMASFIVNMLYLVSIFIVLSVLALQIKSGVTSLPAALGLAVAYIQSTQSLISMPRRFRRYMRGWTAVNDLFDFMANFGQQGYPVLGAATSLGAPKTTIAIEARGISFNYETADLFNHHSFILTCPRDQHTKLFGIIGESGSGKSTLLSILGGQLKPIEGTVMINGIDIYAINDATRRTLIALQGQVATSVRGTIKYNLLFGLPAEHGFSDQQLLDVLQRVGLLIILEAHNGLETMLGEGGLNMSGGQRQRLNFAGLYLRSIFYKPVLILIDEPTSSLDEVSEAAITHMIIELSTFAMTLVIAHRLKTVEHATGLIDLSLLHDEHEIKPYTSQELVQRSPYYQQLIHGHVTLEG